MVDMADEMLTVKVAVETYLVRLENCQVPTTPKCTRTLVNVSGTSRCSRASE